MAIPAYMWLMKTLLISWCINQRGAGQHVEILDLLPRVVDSVPLNFNAFKRLAGCYRFIEIRAGAIKFFLDHKRRM